MDTFEVLSLMLSFGMFVIAILKYKNNDENKHS
ncbi:putative holin-like toxin [Rossellomorea aquimaris]